MSDYSKSTNFIFTSKGLPTGVYDRIDFSIGLRKINLGQPKPYEVLGEGGFYNGILQPFNDIVGKFNGFDYIVDPGSQMYPSVLVDHAWTDPGALNGIIEPLSVRETLSNTAAEGPIVARSLKACLMPNVGSEILGTSIIIESAVPFAPVPVIPPYYDSQDAPFTGDGFNLSFPGYDYPEPKDIPPFNDALELKSTDFSILNSATGSLDVEEFGVYKKSAPTGFIYREGSYTIRQSSSLTGAKRVMGTDSIAFGGLLK
jgi:hypothetical protein